MKKKTSRLKQRVNADRDWKLKRKIVHLPGTNLSPEVVLARSLEKIKQIKAVVVIMQWEDGSVGVDWSNMKISEICMAAKVFDDAVGEVLRNAE